MNGRDSFSKHRFVIITISKLFKYLPKFVNFSILSLISPRDGKVFSLLRYIILKNQCSSLGDNVYIGSNVKLINVEKLKVGSNVSIHTGCYIDALGEIEIENNVSIAHSTSILSFDHTWSNPDLPIKYNELSLGKVVVESDVWIGCGVRILAGIIISQRSIIAAGSVVTKDVPSGVLVGGIPAKVIKRLS